eukprot:m.43253 g.43253  ORF g.43253 m.43253 type:complete len:55 (+) comp10751_c0_seq2:1905-2069(+)
MLCVRRPTKKAMATIAAERGKGISLPAPTPVFLFSPLDEKENHPEIRNKKNKGP